jgi:hypothetical protein
MPEQSTVAHWKIVAFDSTALKDSSQLRKAAEPGTVDRLAAQRLTSRR